MTTFKTLVWLYCVVFVLLSPAILWYEVFDPKQPADMFTTAVYLTVFAIPLPPLLVHIFGYPLVTKYTLQNFDGSLLLTTMLTMVYTIFALLLIGWLFYLMFAPATPKVPVDQTIWSLIQLSMIVGPLAIIWTNLLPDLQSE